MSYYVEEKCSIYLIACVCVRQNTTVDVSAIGIGDMFDQIEENESLKSIACQKDGRVLGMKRFADLVAEEFINEIETVLCPGTLTRKAHITYSMFIWWIMKLFSLVLFV